MNRCEWLIDNTLAECSPYDWVESIGKHFTIFGGKGYDGESTPVGYLSISPVVAAGEIAWRIEAHYDGEDGPFYERLAHDNENWDLEKWKLTLQKRWEEHDKQAQKTPQTN